MDKNQEQVSGRVILLPNVKFSLSQLLTLVSFLHCQWITARLLCQYSLHFFVRLRKRVLPINRGCGVCQRVSLEYSNELQRCQTRDLISNLKRKEPRSKGRKWQRSVRWSEMKSEVSFTDSQDSHTLSHLCKWGLFITYIAITILRGCNGESVPVSHWLCGRVRLC